jgi:BioD-like phosphotransacetylase family protein
MRDHVVPVLIVASADPGAGRSVIAAALAYRYGRAGSPITLLRLLGDDGASRDASVFASLDDVNAPHDPVSAAAVMSWSGDVVVEASPGSVEALCTQMQDARVVSVGPPGAATLVPSRALVGEIVTRVPAADVTRAGQRSGVLAALPEDAILAAPSASDIASALEAQWVSRPDEDVSVGQVMIGTVASDAATPYFGNRRSTCIVTRFDKTDIQLAALNTDIECLVLTGGGEPSPYLIDRIATHRPDVAVLLTHGTTVDAVRDMEPLFGASRFDGRAKLQRAVELLDAAKLEIAF